MRRKLFLIGVKHLPTYLPIWKFLRADSRTLALTLALNYQCIMDDLAVTNLHKNETTYQFVVDPLATPFLCMHITTCFTEG